MGGWKTWSGAAGVFVSAGVFAVAEAYPEYQWLRMAAIFLAAGGASLGLVGVGHKIEKKSK